MINRILTKNQDIEITETLGFAILLAWMGGFMDVYSYMVRGNVFATGQTGNFVLAAIHLSERNYYEMLHAIVPIISFWGGNFIAWHIYHIYLKENQLLWKRSILVIELFILFITGFIPCSYPNLIANSLVSFAASLQYCTFRKFGSDEGYASIFCTGNMRSCAEYYYNGVVGKDRQSLRKAFRYSYILIAFFAGVVSGAIESSILHERSIWSVVVLLSIALLLSCSSFKFKEQIVN